MSFIGLIDSGIKVEYVTVNAMIRSGLVSIQSSCTQPLHINIFTITESCKECLFCSRLMPYICDIYIYIYIYNCKYAHLNAL